MKKEKKGIVKDNHELYIRKIFANNLKKLRGDRHMSQMELAAAANLSSNFINEMENEKKWPSIETLAKLMKALSVEPVHFFTPDIVMKINDADILKRELSALITTVINERIERYTNNSQIAEKPSADAGSIVSERRGSPRGDNKSRMK